MYKIIFLDIDGTLVNNSKKITPAVLDSVIKAQEHGIIIAVASGRPDKGIYKVANELRLAEYGGYILSFNGGKIKNYKTGEIISENTLPLNAVDIAYKFSKKNGIELITYDGDTIISETPDNKYLLIEARINNLDIEVVPCITDRIKNHVPKCLLLGDGDKLEKLEPILRAEIGDTANVFRSEPYFLEVVPNGIDKAKSIETLINALGIKQEEVIAMGDGFNDVSMVKYAGLGVAMENGCDAIKKIADIIAPSNENNGVSAIIEKYIFNND